MIRNVLTRIGGVENYGLISIGLFFLFFCGVLWWSLRLRRSDVEWMSHLPLDHGETPDTAEKKANVYE